MCSKIIICVQSVLRGLLSPLKSLASRSAQLIIFIILTLYVQTSRNAACIALLLLLELFIIDTSKKKQQPLRSLRLILYPFTRQLHVCVINLSLTEQVFIHYTETHNNYILLYLFNVSVHQMYSYVLRVSVHALRSSVHTRFHRKILYLHIKTIIQLTVKCNESLSHHKLKNNVIPTDWRALVLDLFIRFIHSNKYIMKIKQCFLWFYV